MNWIYLPGKNVLSSSTNKILIPNFPGILLLKKRRKV